LIAITDLGPDQGRWLTNAIIVLAAIGAALYYSLASVEKFKSLRGGSFNIANQPLAVVVEKSLAEKFVGTQHFETFEKYVHDAHHKIANDIGSVKLGGEERGRELEDLLRQLNEKNEKRSGEIFGAIQKEGRRLDERVNDVLREVSKLSGAFDQSQRRRV
jgi:hypothetical protein